MKAVWTKSAFPLYDFKPCDIILQANKEICRHETPWIEIPFDENYPDLCLFTEVKIYDKIKLQPMDSIITQTVLLSSSDKMLNKTHVAIIYTLIKTPDWELQYK